jgi:CRP/FNR family cyclic AMP-dependent transcriptional regulator
MIKLSSMITTNPHGTLRQMPIFGGLSDEELDKIVSLATSVEAPRGTVLVREGDLAKELFVIQQGTVEVIAAVDEEHERVLAELSAGDCFGEMALIDIQPRSASVRALEDTMLLSLSNGAFRSLSQWKLETYTLVTLNLAREISRRLRNADALLAEFARRHPDELREPEIKDP